MKSIAHTKAWKRHRRALRKGWFIRFPAGFVKPRTETRLHIYRGQDTIVFGGRRAGGMTDLALKMTPPGAAVIDRKHENRKTECMELQAEWYRKVLGLGDK